MTEPLTEKDVRALLILHKAAARKAAHLPLGATVVGVLGAFSLVRSDGLGGFVITDTGERYLRTKYVFCEAIGCDGVLRRKDVLAPMYLGPTVQKDSKGRQFIACPVCGIRNVLEPLALSKSNTLRVVEIMPSPSRSPPSSH